MSAGVAAAIKAAIAVLSNEEARKKVGWVIVAILSPLIVLVVVKLFFEIEDDTKRLGGQKAFLLGKKMFEF